MSCDVDKATEGLENKSFDIGEVTERLENEQQMYSSITTGNY